MNNTWQLLFSNAIHMQFSKIVFRRKINTINTILSSAIIPIFCLRLRSISPIFLCFIDDIGIKLTGMIIDTIVKIRSIIEVCSRSLESSMPITAHAPVSTRHPRKLLLWNPPNNALINIKGIKNDKHSFHRFVRIAAPKKILSFARSFRMLK